MFLTLKTVSRTKSGLQTAILASDIVTVDDINEKLLNSLPFNTISFKSMDTEENTECGSLSCWIFQHSKTCRISSSRPAAETCCVSHDAEDLRSSINEQRNLNDLQMFEVQNSDCNSLESTGCWNKRANSSFTAFSIWFPKLIFTMAINNTQRQHCKWLTWIWKNRYSRSVNYSLDVSELMVLESVDLFSQEG